MVFLHGPVRPTFAGERSYYGRGDALLDRIRPEREATPFGEQASSTVKSLARPSAVPNQTILILVTILKTT